jgi:hypothetical protein
MSYNYDTSKNSPNFTPASQVRATWGRGRTIEKIAIHWWDDPLNNPSYEGVIATLCNPARQASAHFVATGTGRRVACLVNLPDASWATNSANPYTISIECDPRCRPEDYDVIGELVAELRREYGNIPLMRHSDVISTRCPGNYVLSQIDAVAATKNAGANFGTSTNKTATTPPPAPAPAPAPVIGYKVFIDGKQVGAYSVDKNAYNKYVQTGRVGVIKDSAGVDVTVAVVSRFEPPKPTPTPTPIPPTPSDSDRIGALEKEVSGLKLLVGKIVDFLSKLPIFK